MTVGGRTFQTGFGASGDAMIPYDLPASEGTGWKVLSGWVGIDEGEKKIEGDGAEFMVTDGSVVLWRSGFMKRHEPAKRFEVSFPPATRRVYLQTYSGRNIWSDHCDWCELQTRITGGRAPSPSVVELRPSGTRDAGHEFRQALSRLHEQGGVIRLAKGEYHFYSDSALALAFQVSNNDHPRLHHVALPFVGLRNVTLEGNGSKFILHGSMVAALLMDCENVTIRGVDVEYAESHNFDATVVGFEPGKTLIRFDEKRFPFVIGRDRRIYFKGYGGLWMQGWGCIAFDGQTGEIIERTADIGFPGRAVRRPDGVVAADGDISKWGAGIKPGDVVSIRNIDRENPTVVLYRAKDSLFEDVVLRNGFGMAFICQRSENITYRGSKTAAHRTAGVFAGEGRRGSASADATHFSCCRGLVTVENCWFEGMMDDAINVCATCLKIVEKTDPRHIRCRYMQAQGIGFETFLPGETLQFIKGPTLENGPMVKVAGVLKLGEQELELALTEDMPPEYGVGDAVENADWHPSVRFIGNVVTHNRARGCLFTTPRKVEVRGNLFERVSGSAIVFPGDAQSWYTTGACTDVLVEGNVFRDNLTSRYQYTEGVISIFPEVRRLSEQKRAYHRNIVVRRNRFETFDVPLLYAQSAEGVHFDDNEIVYDLKSKYRGWGRKPFRLDHVKDFTFERNTVKGRGKFAADDVEQISSVKP